MKRYDTFQDCPTPWLAQVPSHWRKLRYKDVMRPKDIKVGDNPVTLLSLTKKGVIVRDISEGKGKFPSDFSSYKIVEPNDLIICLFDVDETPRTVGIAHDSGMITGAYDIFNVANVSRDFLLYHFLHIDDKKAFKPLYKGLRKVVPLPSLLSSYVYLPPILEQEAIVAFLDSKISKIDAYIGERDKEIIALGELKQAVIASVVTRGLNLDVPMRDSGIPWLGQIPAHWKELKLSQVAREHYISNKDVHHQNLLSLSYGKIIRKDINRTDGLLPASFDGYQIVEPGNIVLRLTDLQNDQKSLRVGLVTEEGIVTGAYLSLEVRDNILPEYAYLFLHTSDIHKYFYTMGSGIRQGLNYSGIRDIKVPVSSIDEQQAIVDYINAKTAKIDGLIADLSAQIERLKEYKQRLISDAVTGQIDVRDYKHSTSAQ